MCLGIISVLFLLLLNPFCLLWIHTATVIYCTVHLECWYKTYLFVTDECICSLLPVTKAFCSHLNNSRIDLVFPWFSAHVAVFTQTCNFGCILLKQINIDFFLNTSNILSFFCVFNVCLFWFVSTKGWLKPSIWRTWLVDFFFPPNWSYAETGIC